ncbi:ferric reductase transmembrane protein-like protein [Leishmania major strain Friedlin]|uniref:Ferric reductase transmembrane protein-like protein n=1 Tax=Leishmania major TaxID=5664 RepID=Q4Q789_LEIMA|nr:ferric reductase transmembrane protein-like protein [Leishmania major strain Friedlin]CAG9578438.1 ferric_reductase_transmembrane_protein-like_protein [Leishmania major strain Friedlin]CAJ06394.1 ferric reductase transmembrane protein-like protein [Leishmania major strain Friedlin]|eukprot:XP_001684809.1 ferric reductase transmembrane protein-like protein [Leishmania major strain Friedlin]
MTTTIKDDASLPSIDDIPAPSVWLKSLCRRLAAVGIIVPVSLQLFRKSGTYTDIFQYHPICMMLAFVMVLPDVVRDIKQLRQAHRRSPLKDRLPRHEIIMRHQLASFVMELAAAGGFAAVEYTKLKNHYPHLESLHGIVGTLCGLTIVCQMVLGSILRYVLAPANPKRLIVRTVHKCVSVTIAVTAMMAMAGGFLATEYAERMIPASLIRTAIVLTSVATTVAGFLM